MENSSGWIIEKARQEREQMVDLLARRFDFPNIRLLGQAAGLDIAYFVGEKMTRFEMAESLVQVADRKGLFGSVVDQLLQPSRTGSEEFKRLLGISVTPAVVEGAKMAKEFKVFLSHSSVDKPFVRPLRDRLVADGYTCWVDEVEIKVGYSIRRAIEDGIIDSGYFGIVLSPDSVGSEWVQRELDMAILREIRQKNVFVLPILYRDCDIPPFLEVKKYADFRKSFDQGYADLLEAIK
jgi:hypothetical protein